MLMTWIIQLLELSSMCDEFFFTGPSIQVMHVAGIRSRGCQILKPSFLAPPTLLVR